MLEINSLVCGAMKEHGKWERGKWEVWSVGSGGVGNVEHGSVGSELPKHCKLKLSF